MATDSFELIARFLGMDPEQLRQLASEDTDDPDLNTLSELFGIDLTTLTELQDIDPEEGEWDLTLDADIDWLTDPSKSPRRSRRGIGIRPNRRSQRANPSQNAPSSRGDWECPTCDRTFLSHQGLQRHYEANPSHADATLDAQAFRVDPDENQTESEWIAFDDRVETFITLPEGATEDNLTITYQSDEDLVEIRGATETTINTSDITALIEDDVTWRVTGRYLLISFPRRNNDS